MLCTDAAKPVLHPAYSVPYKVLRWGLNTFEIMLASKPTTVFVNRLKPAWTSVEIPQNNTDILTSRHDTIPFSATVDVKHFLPEDVTMIMVSATYENRQVDKRTMLRSLYHSTLIPQSVDTVELLPTLSRDGILHVPAPDYNMENRTRINLQPHHRIT
ncbi:heat shock protein beta-6-like [Schistocerca americana]|uniref:heat shock protein beta-6-like n=1 Tax=Schistocerca americana TaxID=7009 RepID=UPI001F4FDF77|nr:heat shock protein beta-6-like [Schistocerca americana]